MNFSSRILDIVVVVFILATAIKAYRKGLVSTVLHFFPMLTAIIATRFLTPFVGKFLRKTPFFGMLADGISKGVHLEQNTGMAVGGIQTNVIGNMHLPDFLKDSLLENNNPVVYDLLHAEGMQAYVASFLANICMNIISALLVFAAAYLIAQFFLNALNLVSRLPGLNFFNRSCGFFIGGVKGVCMIWLVCFVLTFFQCSMGMTSFFQIISQTHVVSALYEHNILMYFILTIFT